MAGVLLARPSTYMGACEWTRLYNYIALVKIVILFGHAVGYLYMCFTRGGRQ